MSRKWLIYILLILTTFKGFSQISDSINYLSDKLKTVKTDSEKLFIFMKMADLYKSAKFQKSIEYRLQAYDLAKKINKTNIEIQNALELGNYYLSIHKFSNSIIFLKRSLYLAEKMHDKAYINEANLNLTDVFVHLDKYDSATIYLSKSIQINDSLLVDYQKLQKYLTIAKVYNALYLTDLSIFYLHLAQILAATKSDSLSFAKIYYETGNINLFNAHTDIAIVFYKKALSMCPENALNVRCHILTNLGKSSQLQGLNNYALLYYQMAFKQANSLSDTFAMLESYINLANIYMTKSHKISEGFLNLALNLAQPIYYSELPLKIKIQLLDNISTLEQLKGNYSNAITFLREKEELTDTLNSITFRAITFSYIYRYDLNNKSNMIDSLLKQKKISENKIQKQTTKTKTQSVTIFLLIALILISLFFLHQIFRNLTLNRNYNKELNERNWQLIESQNKITGIIDSLPEIFIEFDKFGKINRVNQNFYIISKYSEFDYKSGMNLYDFFDKSNHQEIEQNINILQNSDQVKNIEANFLCKDKLKFPCLISFNSKKIADEIEFYAIVVDITEKQKNEQYLKFFKTTVEQTNTVVAITDKNANIIYVNPAFERVTGYRYNEVLNNNPKILQSGLTAVTIYDELWETILSGKVWKGNFINKRKNGDIYYERTTISPLKDENGQITHFIATKDDITEEVVNSENLTKLFSSVEISPNSVIILNTDKEITYVNPAFEKISGYSKEEVIGKSNVFLNNSKYSDNYFKNIWKDLTENNTWQGVYINIKKDGKPYWVSSSIVALKNTKGQSIGYVANEIDITEQTETYDKLEKTLSELNEKNNEIISSLEYAKRIQRSLIPTEDQLKSFIDCFVLYIPKDIVSGDFYWFYNKVILKYLVVADCTGHGVPGAFLSILGINLLEDAIVMENVEIPSDILKYVGLRLNKILVKANERDRIQDDIEISLLCVNEHEKTLSYASSRSRMYIVRKNDTALKLPEIFELLHISAEIKMFVVKGVRDFLVSNVNFANFTDTKIQYQSSDIFYLTTDGYYDQFGGENSKKFKRSTFEDYLFDISIRNFDQQKELLLYKLLLWKTENFQNDDITVVGFSLP